MLQSCYLVEVTRGRVGLGLENIGPLPGLGWLKSLHKGLDGLELSSVFRVSMVPMLGPYHLSLGKETPGIMMGFMGHSGSNSMLWPGPVSPETNSKTYFWNWAGYCSPNMSEFLGH